MPLISFGFPSASMLLVYAATPRLVLLFVIHSQSSRQFLLTSQHDELLSPFLEMVSPFVAVRSKESLPVSIPSTLDGYLTLSFIWVPMRLMFCNSPMFPFADYAIMELAPYPNLTSPPATELAETPQESSWNAEMQSWMVTHGLQEILVA